MRFSIQHVRAIEPQTTNHFSTDDPEEAQKWRERGAVVRERHVSESTVPAMDDLDSLFGDDVE